MMKFLLLVAVLCVVPPSFSTYDLSLKYTAKTFNHRQRFLVLHYTATNFTESLRLLTEHLSSHYLVPSGLTNGRRVVYQLVPEEKRAWTQGISSWRKRTNLNDQGVSIEIVNRGYALDIQGNKHWFMYDHHQMLSVVELCQDIIQRYDISPRNVIGHSDCAPDRKQDPGPLFPWKQLYDSGVGSWPYQDDVFNFKNQYRGQVLKVQEYQNDLSNYGYEINTDGVLTPQTTAVIQKFQMHFRQNNYDGKMDLETFAILKALLKRYA